MYDLYYSLVLIKFLSLTYPLINFAVASDCTVPQDVISRKIREVSQGYFTNDISDYKFVHPTRIFKGEYYSHLVTSFFDHDDSPGSRAKRQISVDDTIHYNIPIDETTNYTVVLSPNYDVLSPSSVIERLTNSSKYNAGNVRLKRASKRLCYYKGTVLNQPASQVALSTCKGLAGFIRSADGDFFIEPINNYDPDNSLQPHIIFKRRVVDTINTNDEVKSNCKVKVSNDNDEKLRLFGQEDLYRKSPYDYNEDEDVDSFYNSSTERVNQHAEVKKRQVEYQSCKLPNECKNKTECSWDIRLLIVVSYLFSQRHKSIDLETFVLTLINIINRNFQDDSLGFNINVKLVRMVFIEYKLDELDEDKLPLEELFENFCLFQYRINPFRLDHPNHHDLGIYLISSNICNVSTTYGVSYQGSLCECHKACIVSKDEGLLLGNIITHQIGHSLGADHDAKGTETDVDICNNPYFHFMDPMITLNSSMWSKCSAQAIRKFVKSTGYSCLKHHTMDISFDWSETILPGQIYDAVHQCSMSFQLPLLPCFTGDFCKALYCQANEDQCVSRLVPPADGTVCAGEMWCIRGYCVKKGRFPSTVNGEWNGWEPWGPCSRSCGGGVQSAARLCNNPRPAKGGRYCAGPKTRHRMCNTQKCSLIASGFRDVQCKDTDIIPFRERYYRWRSFHNIFNYLECSLICQSAETHIVAVRQLVVEDGTPCKPGTRNVCISGKCHDIGCDWGINSDAIQDACGVCHGNGTECRIVQGMYSEKRNTGMVPFMKTPKGTGMIYAKEVSASDVTFVVSSYNTGVFYLNGPDETRRVEISGDYDFGTNRGLYASVGRLERIFIPGPIDEDLVFYAQFNKDDNHGIEYQFAIPEVVSEYVPSYSWQFIDWDLCSDACGGGQQRSRAKCVEDYGGIVESMYCAELAQPLDVIRSCNEFPCVPRWWVGSWSDCVSVNNESVRFRSILCMRTRDPSSLRAEILKDKYCCQEEKPDSVRLCNITRCQDNPNCDTNKPLEDDPDQVELHELHGLHKGRSKAYTLQHFDQNYFADAELNNDGMEDIDDFDKDEAEEEFSSNIKQDKKQKMQDLVFDHIVKNVLDETKNVSLPHKNPLNKDQKHSGLKEPVMKKVHFFANTKHTTPFQFAINKSTPTMLSTKLSLFYGMIEKNGDNKQCDTTKSSKESATCTSNSKGCNTTEVNLPFQCPNANNDLHVVIDEALVNEFKISIAPVYCEALPYRPGDPDYEHFEKTITWVVGQTNNATTLTGAKAIAFIQELRKNMSRIPFIYHAEN